MKMPAPLCGVHDMRPRADGGGTASPYGCGATRHGARPPRQNHLSDFVQRIATRYAPGQVRHACRKASIRSVLDHGGVFHPRLILTCLAENAVGKPYPPWI